MKRIYLAVIPAGAMALILAVNACVAPDQSTSLTPKEAAAVRQIVLNWLDCDDCTDGEAENLAALGAVAVGPLQAALEDGPSPARRVMLRWRYGDLYQTIADQAASHSGTSPGPSKDEYVERHLANTVRMYRSRAIAGLAHIGDPSARDALRAASQLPLDQKSRDLLDKALKDLN